MQVSAQSRNANMKEITQGFAQSPSLQPALSYPDTPPDPAYLQQQPWGRTVICEEHRGPGERRLEEAQP